MTADDHSHAIAANITPVTHCITYTTLARRPDVGNYTIAGSLSPDSWRPIFSYPFFLGARAIDRAGTVRRGGITKSASNLRLESMTPGSPEMCGVFRRLTSYLIPAQQTAIELPIATTIRKRRNDA